MRSLMYVTQFISWEMDTRYSIRTTLGGQDLVQTRPAEGSENNKYCGFRGHRSYKLAQLSAHVAHGSSFPWNIDDETFKAFSISRNWIDSIWKVSVFLSLISMMGLLQLDVMS